MFKSWFVPGVGGSYDLPRTPGEGELHADGADLEVTATFGGVTIRVRDDWRVLVEGRPVFGGVEDARPSRKRDAEAPTLRVHASALFGGIEITG